MASGVWKCAPAGPAHGWPCPGWPCPGCENGRAKVERKNGGASISRDSKNRKGQRGAAKESNKQQRTLKAKLRDSDTDKRLQIADAIFVATNSMAIKKVAKATGIKRYMERQQTDA